MSEGKLLILGAGIYQVPLIRKAREMGLFTLVVSIPGDYPGISEADRFVPLDTRDKEAVLELARRESIDGICTSGTDVAVRTIGYVCSALGLPGIGGEAAKLVTDKLLMKQALVSGGVSTAAFYRAESPGEARQAADRLGYPVVVKAPDSSGSRGVMRAENEEQLAEAFVAAKRVSQKSYVLVEEYIRAEEIGVDGYVGEDGLEDFFPHGKYTYTANGITMPVGHRFPWEESGRLSEDVREQIERAVNALNLRSCPFNADVFVQGERVWVIEIGARTGATCIPELLTCYTGTDWYEKIIRAALGIRCFSGKPRRQACSAKLVFSPVNDVIREIDREGLDRLCAECIDCQLDYDVGHPVEAMKNGTDRIGHLIAPVSDEALLDGYLSRMRSCIRLGQGNLEKIWRSIEHEDRF